jgi:DNA primase
MFLDDLVKSTNSSIHRYEGVLTYLKSRRVTVDEIAKFKIGYGKVLHIPDDGSADRHRFMEETWRGKKFEGMILFPFTDSMGRIVGLVGRSPETKLFKVFVTDEAKYTGFFFGLYQALPEIYRTGRAYIVEGPFDLMAITKVVPNAVGALTAGLSDAQFEMLRLYCDNIVTIFDSDLPGDRATNMGVEWVQENNSGLDSREKWNIRNIRLGYKDPDDCLKQLSTDRFKSFILKKIKDIPPW